MFGEDGTCALRGAVRGPLDRSRSSVFIVLWLQETKAVTKSDFKRRLRRGAYDLSKSSTAFQKHWKHNDCVEEVYKRLVHATNNVSIAARRYVRRLGMGQHGTGKGGGSWGQGEST